VDAKNGGCWIQVKIQEFGITINEVL